MIMTIREDEHKVECVASGAGWLLLLFFFFSSCDADERLRGEQSIHGNQWRMLTSVDA